MPPAYAVSAAGPRVDLDDDDLVRYLAQQAAANAVPDQATLVTVMGTIFQTGTAGVQPLTQAARVFLAGYFSNRIKVS